MIRNLIYSLSVFGGFHASIQEVCDIYSIEKNAEIPEALKNLFTELSDNINSEMISLGSMLEKIRTIKNKKLFIVSDMEARQIKKGLEEMKSLFEDYDWLLKNVCRIDAGSIQEIANHQKQTIL